LIVKEVRPVNGQILKIYQGGDFEKGTTFIKFKD